MIRHRCGLNLHAHREQPLAQSHPNPPPPPPIHFLSAAIGRPPGCCARTSASDGGADKRRLSENPVGASPWADFQRTCAAGVYSPEFSWTFSV
ncbi:hypothetical protein AAFF_G00294670 [Aldrovandia affinis]|uniref:Uncharacterized protein n=1 Tax=Aldrovandia affinis TaxID=143900 RepID=A0AAD7R977_9TELE|nr:hypothetical protein AAFF_G00294670 [Aldrovandia affinis]